MAWRDTVWAKRNPPEGQGGVVSGDIALAFLDIEEDLAKILDERIDIFAKEAEIDDEGERTAEAFAVFQRSIGTGVHHELFGKLCLGEFFELAGLGKAVGQVETEGTFAGVLHG